jgi:nitrogen fixation NifU-like protein
MYNEKVMKHFRAPQYVGEIKDADAIGKVGNPQCGDIMQIYIKVKDNKIEDIKVKTFGCVAALSTSDVVCDLAIGKTLEVAEKITKDDVIKELGELPPQKVHCSVLAQEALKDAIDNYRKKTN